jgi:hypothetical protein
LRVADEKYPANTADSGTGVLFVCPSQPELERDRKVLVPSDHKTSAVTTKLQL